MTQQRLTMTKDASRLRQEQVERLCEIGAYLRQVRERYGLSLDEVATQTMIQARLLRAIEEGSLEKLPEPVYIQGFIKLYADALGLDGNECADAFPTEKQMRVAQASTWKDSPAAQLRPLHLYLAYIALIMASVSLLSHLVSRSSPETVISASPLATSGLASPEPPSPIPSPSPSPDVTNRPPNDPSRPVRVDVTLTAQSWMRVVIDGSTEFEGVLPEGTEETWMGTSQIIVRAGNAGGVMVSHNQGQAERMGAPGAVEERAYTLNQESAQLLGGAETWE
jgi:cytoskeletal protein RodZ